MDNFKYMLEKNRKNWMLNTDKSVPLNNHYPDIPLRELFKRWAIEQYDKPYIVMGDTEITYGESNKLICRIANALLKLEVEKGDRVALMLPNIPEYILSFQALLKIGAIEIPINNRLTSSEIEILLEDSGAETIIILENDLSKIVSILESNKTKLRRVIYCDNHNNDYDGVTEKSILDRIDQQPNVFFSYKSVINEASSLEPTTHIQPEDIARLQYTGGTTGVPKGCVLTNRMLMIQSYLTSMWYTSGYSYISREEVRTLCTIPLTHIYGFNSNINLCLFTGGTIVISSPKDINEIIKIIHEKKPTIFATVPKMIMDMIECERIESLGDSSLKGIFCGSSPLPKDKIEYFELKTGALILEGYGLSEASCTVTVNPVKSKRKVGSCGIARPDTDLLIVDIETGTKALDTGEVGEIIISGQTVIKEYWNNKEETEKVIRGNWLYTGDIGMLDEEGYLFIKCRKKELIISSGFNIYPAEVENVIYKIPSVSKVCVVGINDQKRGEVVKAYVELKKNEDISENDIIEFCKKNLVSYKIPKVIEFVEKMPVTVAGKIDRKKLKGI